MLTPEALIERRKGLGGSDAAKIISGEWFDLWQIKTGRKPDADLAHVWPVQLGICTESLNLYWYGRTTGHKPTRCGDVVVCAKHPILRCTLDGFDADDGAVIQAKHVNGFSQIEDVTARYAPQVQHEMIVTDSARGYLSVIIGSNEPVVVPMELDDFWAAEYIEKCEEFWRYVVEDKEPPGAPVPLPPPVALDKMRTVSMEGKNSWSAEAATFLETIDAAGKFEKAKKALKDLVEPDVRRASGHGVVATRDKRGVAVKKDADYTPPLKEPAP